MKMSVKFFCNDSLSVIITVLIGLLTHQHFIAASNEEQLASFCEGQMLRLMCQQNMVVHIVNDSLQYGLLDEPVCFELTPTIPANVSKIPECTADPDYVKSIVFNRCNGKGACDIFKVQDSTFGLSDNFDDCPYLNRIDSQLLFLYSCQPELSRSRTQIATLPTLGPEPTLVTLPDRCHANQVKEEDCYMWVCEQGAWRNESALLDDPTCCIFWEQGCADDALTLNHSSSSTNQHRATMAPPITTSTNPSEILTMDITTTFPTVATERSEGTTAITPATIVQTIVQTTNAEISPISEQRTATTTVAPTTAASAVASSTFTLSETSIYIRDCPAENTTSPFSLSWPVTPGNFSTTVACPGDPRIVPAPVYRKCNADGTWEDQIDTSSCASPSIVSYVKKDIESEEQLEVYTAGLANVTQTEDLLSGDIQVLTRALNDIGADLKGLRERDIEVDIVNITRNVLVVGDNLLRRGSKNAWQGVKEQQKSSKTVGVMAALESVVRESAESLTTDLSVQTPSIELIVKVVELENVSSDHRVSISSQGGSITFPASNFVSGKKGSGYGKLVTVFYNSSIVWSSQGNLTVNAPVFSASILDDGKSSSRKQLKSPFVYTLQHRKISSHLHQCVFWDDSAGNWSKDGCRRVKDTDKYSVCECDHLTNFAVLLDVTGVTEELTAVQTLSLQIITYAGCIISIVCLLLSWLTFQCLKNLSSDRNTIHKHLVFTLMLAESLFLVSISPQVVKLEVFCSVLAGILHFLFLSVFAWTCLEGVQLYIMLIEVFESGRSRVWYYYLAGYGIPALIVAISAAVDHKGYGTPSVCWLNAKTGFIWSFVGPVAAVMLVNLVMLGIAIYMMYHHAKTVANIKHKETTKLDSFRAWVKGAVVLVVLLGLTWVFGFLYVNKDTLVMAYIFTILNSLQGVFIFIFHCFGNEKVQKEYKKYVRRTQWLPNCLRVGYGEHKGLSSSASHSSASNGYLSRYFSRRRKSSDLTGGSLRAKRQISGLSTNSNAIIIDGHYNPSREPLTSPSQKMSTPPFHHTEFNQEVNPMLREESIPSLVGV